MKSLPDIEEVVLSTLISFGSKPLDEIGEVLQSEYFTSIRQDIAEAIRSLHVSNTGIDIVTVSDVLSKSKKIKSIGYDYLVQLANWSVSPVGFERHYLQLKEQYTARTINDVAENMRLSILDKKDVFDIIENGQKQFDTCLNKIIPGKLFDKSSYYQYFSERNQKIKSGNGLTGISTGFPEIDNLSGGWQKSDLIILAGRPSMGKTSLALQFGINSAIHNSIPAAIFSLEMSGHQLMDKLVSNISGIESDMFKKTGISGDYENMAAQAIQRIETAPIYIDNTAAPKLSEIRIRARKMRKSQKIELLIVDYLQLIRGDERGNREQEISSISRGLKALAMELDIPIIALSQLSRSVETRGGDKRPMLSDLRESGAIEQDADMVSFIYRPEYYGFLETESGASSRGLAQFLVQKNRNGGLGYFNLKWHPEISRFSQWSGEKTYGEKISELQPNHSF